MTDQLDPDALLWHSAQAKAAAVKRAEAIDGPEQREEAARRTYAERQAAIDADRHRRGLERMLAAERRSRDARDEQDEERRR